MPWQSSYPTSDASQRPFGKHIQHRISSPQALSLLGSPIWGNLVMCLMENTVFHKTLLCLQSCTLSYFPTGRENNKLLSTIQPLEYLKTRYVASTQPSQSDCFQMSCFLQAVSLPQINTSLSVTLLKRGSQSRRLRMATEFRKTSQQSSALHNSSAVTLPPGSQKTPFPSPT